MTKYLVYTPPYDPHEGNVFAPPEYGSDVVDVEAATKREALILGLRELRRTNSYWVAEMEGDLRNPFNGLKAESMEADDDGEA